MPGYLGMAYSSVRQIRSRKDARSERLASARFPLTLEVRYSVAGRYGAVETGIHRFHHPGHPEYDVGDAKFIMLWQNKDGAWKVTRVISYDHNHGLLAK